MERRWESGLWDCHHERRRGVDIILKLLGHLANRYGFWLVVLVRHYTKPWLLPEISSCLKPHLLWRIGCPV